MEDSGIDSGDQKPTYKKNIETKLSPSDCSSGSSTGGSLSSPNKSSNTNQSYATSKELQRRLETRIENAKRSHRTQSNTHNQSNEYKNTPGLIPIQRLPIPGGKEQQPLVEWDTDDSEEDVVNFFPISRLKESRHQELTDTFSIEEMSISGGEEEEEEDLHLVPPSPVYKRFGCCEDKCLLM